MIEKLQRWYDGEFKVWETPGLLGFDHKLHWTARIARALATFWLAHWQWTIGTSLAIVGLWISFGRK